MELRDVLGYEGLYSVTDTGLVYGHLRKNYLKPSLTHNGYYYVTLSKPGCKTRHFRVSRLVAQAFIDNPDKLPEVDHINGVKTDNRVENLQWITKADNVRKAKCKKIIQIETGKEFNSIAEAAAAINRTRSNLWHALKNNGKCAGYHWDYVEQKN